MINSRDNSADLAKKLMDEFAEKTGLTDGGEGSQDRYLWTDAFAVQNFLALSSIYDDEKYKNLARNLIDQVHYALGRFAPDDTRTGWISGLSEEEGKKHPTLNGLRIGKKELERQKSEPFDSTKEWDRDGQYYHYHTRWIHALLQAADPLENEQLLTNAAELCRAGRHFLHKANGEPRLYWKMSVDLSYPQVTSMGAHDPLDGYLTALECSIMATDETDLSDYLETLEVVCSGKNWMTTDPLGLGGLLLNTVRSAELNRHTKLPESIRPRKLFEDTVQGLDKWEFQTSLSSSAKYRLAFRECGLSLGLRVADAYRDSFAHDNLDIHRLDDKQNIANDIELFWGDSDNRKQPVYLDHQNINHVSLASSLLAQVEPEVYGVPKHRMTEK